MLISARLALGAAALSSRPRSELIIAEASASAPVTWSTRALRVHWEITGFDALAPLAPETGKGGGRAAAVPRWQRPGGDRTYGGAR